MHGQAVMHYSRHCLTALVAYVTTLTYAPTSGLDLLAHWSVRQKTKPCQFSSVQLRRSVRVLTITADDSAAVGL